MLNFHHQLLLKGIYILCIFFARFGPNLAVKIPPTTKSPTDYLKTNIPGSLFLKPTDEREIKHIASIRSVPRLDLI